MNETANRILTTHTGSLPRPDDLIQMMWAIGDGIPVDREALEKRIAEAVHETVAKQLAAGISIINDGEMSKPGYATYVKDRLHGFGGESIQNYYCADLEGFPKSTEIVAANPGRRKRTAPACNGPISVKAKKIETTPGDAAPENVWAAIRRTPIWISHNSAKESR
jgi:5-methyltetrahydropteroyltriglutamate--homocysteine methyltransferase